MDDQIIKKEIKIVPMLISIIFIAQLFLNGVLLFVNYNQQKEIEKLLSVSVPTPDTSANNQIEKDINSIKGDIIQDKKDIKLNRICHILSINSIVTSKIYINSFALKTDELIHIGILPQPDYEKFFVGQERINLSDREIKAMLQEIINKAKDFYEKETKNLEYMSRFDEYKYQITYHNYEIATYEKGIIKLSGE